MIGRVAQWWRKRTAGPAQRRSYAGAKVGRLMFDAFTSSADQELAGSLRKLRDRSRALVRDNVYAKRAKSIVINNVIGAGVGLQGQVRNADGQKLNARVNAAIEREWQAWVRADACHTGGALHFGDLERLAMGEVFEAGEAFIRLHYKRQRGSRIDLALELIEAERIADDHQISPPAGVDVINGIEHDEQGRAVAYYIHRAHPQRLRKSMAAHSDEIMRVPAEQILHLRLVDRWPQSRGVPALHAAIARLDQLGEYENAALVAARVGASKVGFFEPTEWASEDVVEQSTNGNLELEVEAGQFGQLPAGYRLSSFDPAYPADAFDPFVRAALRGIAAGIGVSYESLSRDYSQSNYSSSRLALLDDRDLWRVLQSWWLRSFREPLHRVWLDQAVYGQALPEIDPVRYVAMPTQYQAVQFKPRGWTWVDPTKEVAAYKEAERAGYTTKADIIAATGNGRDIEDVIAGRRRELDMLDEAGITTDTTAPTEAPVDDEPSATDDDRQAVVFPMRSNHVQ